MKKLVIGMVGAAVAMSLSMSAGALPGQHSYRQHQQQHMNTLVEQAFLDIYPSILAAESYFTQNTDATTLAGAVTGSATLPGGSPLNSIAIANTGVITATFDTEAQAVADNVQLPGSLVGKIITLTPASDQSVDGLTINRTYFLGTGFTCTADLTRDGALALSGQVAGSDSVMAFAHTSLARCNYTT